MWCAVYVMLSVGVLAVEDEAMAADVYPMQVPIIAREDANYKTPENTLFSIVSAMKARDMTWADEALTNEALEAHRHMFEENDIERSELFVLEAEIEETYIVDKLECKDVVLIVVEDKTYDGGTMRYPLSFTLEEGLWKLTNKYGGDEEILRYLSYTPKLFDGKGQNPRDANTFLRYEAPAQATTVVPASAYTYKVHVYYGQRIEAATFSAKLNKVDVTELFDPVPGTDEEVGIPLEQGRNVLVLSVAGRNEKGKEVEDRDRLVFVAE